MQKPSSKVTKSSVKTSKEITPVDSSYLETLMGYNTRRASLSIIAVFLERMAPLGLRPVDFSVLSLIRHNLGITSRQLCNSLNILPPNLVGMITALENRGLIERVPHPSDGRAMGLHLTAAGTALAQTAEDTASQLENEATSRLSATERKTLMRLLQKIYL